MKKKREFFKPYFDGEGGDPLDIAHQYAMAAVALSGSDSAEKQLKREMFKSYFEGEGGDPLDIAQQSIKLAGASSSELPPNLQPGSYALLAPKDISYKAVKLFFDSPQQYKLSKSSIDKFKDLKARWDEIPYNRPKPKERKEAQDLYEELIYNKFSTSASSTVK